MPLMKLDSSRSGSPAARMVGTRVISSRSITLISRRARWAPRQKWGPAAPKPTCGLGERVMSKRAGSVNTVSSLFFFQAEDGIRDLYVTGVQRVLFRSQHCRQNLSFYLLEEAGCAVRGRSRM